MSTQRRWFRISLLAAAVIVSGCASTPRVSSEVMLLQDRLQDMRADPRIATHAADELRDAEQAVAVLDQRRQRPQDFDQNLYLAGRLVNIAEAEGLARHATAEGQALDREREVMLVDSRTREADAARRQAGIERMRADDAQLDRRQAQREADWANQDADLARQQSEQNRMDAELGQQEADMARGDAAEARAEADAARRELALMRTELADLNARQTERGLVVTVGDVLFEVDRAELRPTAQRELDKLVTALASRTGFNLAIEGHTDSTGSAEHNQDLSERRAESVRGYLTQAGISLERTTVTGLGQDHPVSSNDSASGRLQNRRVEIIIQQAEPVSVSAVDRR